MRCFSSSAESPCRTPYTQRADVLALREWLRCWNGRTANRSASPSVIWQKEQNSAIKYMNFMHINQNPPSCPTQALVWSVQTSPLLIKIYSNHTIKAGSSAYAETETLLWLMIWTIAERQSFQAECFPAEKYGISYSAYKECKISFIQVTDVLRLSWSHFVDLADKKYARYLSKK